MTLNQLWKDGAYRAALEKWQKAQDSGTGTQTRPTARARPKAKAAPRARAATPSSGTDRSSSGEKSSDTEREEPVAGDFGDSDDSTDGEWVAPGGGGGGGGGGEARRR
jgi:hypothetical protein